jgi:hypothetical protein
VAPFVADVVEHSIIARELAEEVSLVKRDLLAADLVELAVVVVALEVLLAVVDHRLFSKRRRLISMVARASTSQHLQSY